MSFARSPALRRDRRWGPGSTGLRAARSGRKRPKPPGQVGSELPPEHPDAGQPSPLRQSEDAETYQRLWDAVAELDEREAMVIEMHYRRDWPVEQIADVLECPQGTVKTLLFRARDKLRRKLARQEIANP